MRRITHGLLARVWLREGSVRRAFAGPQRGLRFELRGPITKRLSVFYRAYEPSVNAWLHEHVQPGMTVYVVGGHVGIHALLIAKLLKGSGSVIAFEGWPENYAYLERNFALNADLNVTLQPVAACAARESGMIRMARGSSDGKHHIAADQTAETLDVPAFALDDFAAQSGTTPDLLLIDVEGFEDDVLLGGQGVITARHPAMVIEHHGSTEALTERLRAWGYQPVVSGRHLMMDGRA